MKKYKALTAALLIVIGGIATIGSAKRLGTAYPEKLGQDHYRFLRLIRQLDLTRQQVEEIRTILQDNQSQIDADHAAVAEARCAYDQGVVTGSANLGTLAANLTTAQANLTSFETTVLQQITQDLTTAQITTVAAASCAPSSTSSNQ